MSHYLNIVRYNLRFNQLFSLLTGFGLLILIPIIFGTTALDPQTAPFPLELGLPFLGVILLTPTFSSEQESGLFDTVSVRKTSYVLVCAMRAIVALIAILIFIASFVFFARMMESDISLTQAMACCANTIFMGGLGILASSISGNVIIGYMVPVLYFVLDLMGFKFPFTMFSMMRTGTIEYKGILLIIGVVAIIGSLIIKHIAMKRK